MKIYEVTSVVVHRVSTSPLVLQVHAAGFTATSGWGSPNLNNSADPNPKDAVHEFSFEATKPSGIVLEVITPVSASVQIKPKAADAVIVSSRTNSITVHVSEFIDGPLPARTTLANLTTLALGEESYPRPKFPTTRPALEERMPGTLLRGEDFPRPPMTSPLVDDPMPPRWERWTFPGPDPWDPGPFGNY